MPSSAVMGKFKSGGLHSGAKGGPVVKNRKQAIAIMLSEKRNEDQNGGVYQGGDDEPTPRVKPKRRRA